ncbi:MAG TPA: peptidyl-alpha-hydroxyglycine alpha-amidating lyase family protein [Bryobacteraceae bacterium]|nr:peptidyl-alpha-hydroxyglycine alpha-amidating lyase family protein [Bryobacteraceae bacterium]
MRAAHTKLGVTILTTTAFVAAVQAQTGTCVNDAPNPYHLVNDWAHMPRSWAPTNNVFVDAKDNVWVFDRCEDKGCSGSSVAPIWELSSDGNVLKNFGAGMFVFPHAVVPDKDGNVWVADGNVKDGKGNQVFKLSPDGKVLMTLGKAGEKGAGTDVFDQPTSIAIASNGNIFVAEGHAPTFGNSRIMHFDRNGKFITTFGHVGSGEGEFKSPHVIVFDSKGRLFVADRSNSRVDIYDQDGKFLAGWKQFGRPSGIWIDRKDTLYVSDSESEEANNPGCKRGIRIGSARTGKVDYYIPPPPVSDPKYPPPEGVAADSHGNVYAAAVQAKSVYKYTK